MKLFNGKTMLRWPQNGAFYSIMACVILFGVLNPRFLAFSNFLSVLRQASVYCIITICSFVALVTHQTDLSVGSTASLSAVIAAFSLQNNGSIGTAVLLALLTGLLVGVLNGILIGYTTVAPFIITLGTMNIVQSIGVVLTDGYTVPISNQSLLWLAEGKVLGVPIVAAITIVLYLAIGYVLYRRPYGTTLYAVGGNADAALATGINVKRTKLSVYVISGLLAAIAGLILSARLGSANAAQGAGLELDGICAAVLGGTSLSGGKGSIWGALMGALALAIMRNGLNILGMASGVQMVVTGAIVIVILAFDTLYNARKGGDKK